MSEAPRKSPRLHTHHCLCSNLCIATTRSLPQLSRRNAPGLDKALILPCPPVSQSLLSVGISDAQGILDDDEVDGDNEHGHDDEIKSEITILVSLVLATQPTLVRRSDGIEKRYPLHCGRCKLMVAYQLDWSQFPEAQRSGRRDDVIYLLPNAVMTTTEMAEGKSLADEDVGFGT